MIAWPKSRRFALTAVDDTDWTTVRNAGPVYDLLKDLGLRTTKSVWVFDGRDSAGYQGLTCEDRDYLAWVLSLEKAGFEISLHNAAPVTSGRERTRAALARFEEIFGRRTFIHCNHRLCEENVYWGEHRVTGLRRKMYRWYTDAHGLNRFRGHVDGDPLFWGDLCREHVTYVRNFVFGAVNTLRACPEMPYHDPGKPFVNFWFAATDASSVQKFLRTYTRRRIDRLEEEGGLSIAYVHFGAGFAADGRVDPAFRRIMEYIAAKNGWFVPASTALDFLRNGTAPVQRRIAPQRLWSLEASWLRWKLREQLHRWG